MKKVSTSVALVAAMISVTGCGNKSRPIYNVNRHVMPLEAENLSDKQRSERIRLAAGKQKWSCRETSPQKLICRLKSQKDTASVRVFVASPGRLDVVGRSVDHPASLRRRLYRSGARPSDTHLGFCVRLFGRRGGAFISGRRSRENQPYELFPRGHYECDS